MCRCDGDDAADEDEEASGLHDRLASAQDL